MTTTWKPQTWAEIKAERAAEGRTACTHCRTADEACSDGVATKGRACCDECRSTDTHPCDEALATARHLADAGASDLASFSHAELLDLAISFRRQRDEVTRLLRQALVTLGHITEGGE